MSAFQVQDGLDRRDYTPSVDVTAGQMIRLDDGIAGVIVVDCLAGELGTVYTRGIFDVDKDTGFAFAAGEPVVFDISAQKAVKSTSEEAGDLVAGVALVAAASADTYVRIELNPPGAAAASGAGLPRVMSWSRVAAIDHADTDSHYLLDASENPLGAIVAGFFGEITEQMAGASEDQLIITLYDSDDNALTTLTASDAAADAVGDVVVSPGGLFALSTGAAIVKVPAGKGAYAKVSQATAGTGVAGAMAVRAAFVALS